MPMKLKVAAAFAAVTILVCVCAGGCSPNPSNVQAASGGQATGGQVAQASTFDPVFKTRSPRTCNSVTSVPTVAQIPALIQCTFEQKTAYDMTLITNIKVQTGGFRAYNQFQDGYATSIDTSAKVMPIRGSMVQWLCA